MIGICSGNIGEVDVSLELGLLLNPKCLVCFSRGVLYQEQRGKKGLMPRKHSSLSLCAAFEAEMKNNGAVVHSAGIKK